MATEKRLIDANALIDWLSKHTGFRGNCEDCTDIDCLDCIIENAIKNAPTVDVVTVEEYNALKERCERWKEIADILDTALRQYQRQYGE